MTPQSSFMIVADIRPGRRDDLRRLLATMNRVPGHADPQNRLVPFGRFERLHVARFVILDLKTADEIRVHGQRPLPWRTKLAFVGDVDGDRDSFITELAGCAGPGLRAIFAHCEGFAENTQALAAWVRAHNVRPLANYVNWIGRTVRQIREEVALHRSLAKRLGEMVKTADRDNPRALRQALLSHVEFEKHAGRLVLSPPAAPRAGWWFGNLVHKLAIPAFLAVLAPFALVAAPLFAALLRIHERRDPVITTRPGRDHTSALAAIEDIDVTNQFNVLGDVKPGFFRRATLLVLLVLLDYAARHVFNRGYLTRVKTIHFARWVPMDSGRRLFFASNYDGSLESYMDDFINKVAWGLNLVFSNGVGYPRTSWLIKQGAEREQVFKATLRRHQLPSEVWYKAYPGLSAYDLYRNHEIRRGVETRPTSTAAIRRWLRLI